MRRIYLYLGIGLIALSFWLGYNIGSPSLEVDDQELVRLKWKYDSLGAEFKKSKVREELYYKWLKESEQLVADAEARIEQRDKANLRKQKQYEKRIKELQSYSASELDTFFINRFPVTGSGHSQDSSMESKTDRTATDTVRFPPKRIQEVKPRLSGSTIYLVRGKEADSATWVNQRGEGSADINSAAPDHQLESANIVLAEEGKKIQTPTELGSRWRCSSGRLWRI